MNQISRHKLQTLAIACLLFLTMMYASTCRGQSQQYQIEKVCINHKCRSCSGHIAIYEENLYIKVDTISNHLFIRPEFKHKGVQSYLLKDYPGHFRLCDNVAYLEVYFVCGWITEMYYLKKEL